MKRRLWHFGIVALLFLAGLAPRVKNIQTGGFPTVIPHLQVLQATQVWDEAGGARYAYLPVQTWTGPNDKFVTYFERLQNDKGDNYYVSYPPFAFVLAYGFCKLTDMPLSVLSITVLNLLLQWLGAWCVFGIARRLIPDRGRGIFWPGIAAAAVFICNPASMRLYSQVYFSESVGTTLLCLFFYFAVRVTQEPVRAGGLTGMAVSLFLLAYTEWVGFFAAAVFGIFWSVRVLRRNMSVLPVLLLCVSALAGALLFAYQLDVVTGGGDFLANIKERYLARTGMRDREKSVGDTVFKDGFWQWGLSNLRVTFFAARFFVPVLLAGTWLYLRNKGRETRSAVNNRLSRALFWAVTATVAVNFAVLFNFSMMHNYTWAKWGIPLALAAGWCVYRVQAARRALAAALLLTAGLFVTDLVFYQSFGSKDSAPAYWEELTAFIKKEARPDETIYITTVSEEIDPTFHLTYYTRRNMANVKTQAEARAHAAALGRTHFVWFDFNQFEGRMEAHHSIP